MKFNIFKYFGKKSKAVSGSQRSYLAAQFGRLTSDWMTSVSSADAEIRGPLKTLRARSRDLGRNNEYMTNFYLECQNNIIGANGITLQPQPRQRGDDSQVDDNLKNKIDWLWYHWTKAKHCHTAGRLHFVDIERLIAREVPESGEFYVRFIYQKFNKSKIPLALELIEPDQIDDDLNGKSSNGNDIVMGVEKNKWGQAVAYYVRPSHPGNNSFESVSNNNEPIRIPAEEMIQLGIVMRWPQTRCVPWAVAAMMRLHNMGGYEQAEIVGARAAASLMGVIQSQEGEISGDSVQDGKKLFEFEPGTFKYLNKGEEIQFNNPSRPSGQLDPFMTFMLRGVAAGTGVSYSTISKDYSKGSYSSDRQSMLKERDLWKMFQGWIVRDFHQVVYEKFIEACVLSGQLKIPDFWENAEKYTAAKWLPRGWSWIDPQKETTAAKEAIRGGTKNLSDILAEDGKDFEEQLIQRQKENKLLKKYGVVLDTDPTISRYSGTNSNSQNGDSQDNNTVE